MKFLSSGLIAIGIFLGISLVIAFEFFVDFFGSSISPSETLVATIFGAAIALTGTLFAVYSSYEIAKDREYLAEAQSIFSIFSKMTAVLNALNAQYRHLLDGDERSFLFFGGDVRLKKPASGLARPIEFSDMEKVAPLKIKKAWLFNAINDAQGAIDNLRFLEERHEEAFSNLIEELISQGVRVDGKQISSTSKVRKTDIIELQDLEEHLRRLVNSALPDLKENHQKLIALMEREYDTKVGFYFDPNQPGSVFSDHQKQA